MVSTGKAAKKAVFHFDKKDEQGLISPCSSML